jgi:hypothetical protein
MRGRNIRENINIQRDANVPYIERGNKWHKRSGFILKRS